MVEQRRKPSKPSSDEQRIGAHFDFGFTHKPGPKGGGGWQQWLLAAAALFGVLMAVSGVLRVVLSLITRLSGLSAGGP